MTSALSLDQKTNSVDYSIGQVAQDFSDMATSRGGAKDLIETVMNGCDWMAHLGINKKIAGETSATLEPIKNMFSGLGFLSHLNALRDQYRISEQKNTGEWKKGVFKDVTLGVADAADAAMFFHNTGVYVFKEGLKSIKTAFWVALGAFDLVNLYNGTDKIKDLRAQLDSAGDLQREIVQSRINLTYLSMIQSATTVAMASICLVSLLFASLAQGVLFNPVVMLGLSSAWLVLNFVNYFYDKIICHRQKQLEMMMGSGPKEA